MTASSAYPGVLHKYSSRLVAFEHTRETQNQVTNSLLFVPGLNDGFATIPYIQYLSSHLPPYFSFVEVLLSSAYSGWGTSSLTKDVTEMAQCVSYFQRLRPNGKIVLMGNSTGCQDVMHYLISEGERPEVDGAILQAPISDREAIRMLMPDDLYNESIQTAQRLIQDKMEEDMLPSRLTLPILGARCSASRWLSLASPGPEHDGEDDLFSSDFEQQRIDQIFGTAGKKRARLMILYSGSDQFVPETFDKDFLVRKWKKSFEAAGGSLDEGSGVIGGATHTIKEGGEVLEDFLTRVVKFIERVAKSSVSEAK